MRLLWVIGLGMALYAPAALAQQLNSTALGGAPVHPPAIVSISVCGPIRSGGTVGSCPPGSMDTAQAVLAPGGGIANNYGGMSTLADEHSTIFGPGTLPGYWGGDYLFFVASRTTLNSISSGVVVLTGTGPDANGQWTVDFAPDFGRYFPGQQNGQMFLSAMDHDLCPAVDKATDQDQTFDLNYADPGSVLVDPTSRWADPLGKLLMVYEGTTRCIGSLGGLNGPNNFYSTTGIATSFDHGITWPTYRSNFVPLPLQNETTGPNAPFGALGDSVCSGNDCLFRPPHEYGRYAVLGAPVTIGAVMTQLDLLNLQILPSNMGDSQPAAFIDDLHYHPGPLGGDDAGLWNQPNPYLYVFNVYNPGATQLGAPPLSNGAPFDLVAARAQLNAGMSTLRFSPWYNGGFSEPGLGNHGGGLQSPILPLGLENGASHKSCSAPSESRVMPSVSYVEDTQQYLLVFVCESVDDPLSGDAGPGASWFYSTLDATQYDLSRQDQWTTPQEISGSWSPYITNSGSKCTADFSGWYPSLMSLSKGPGRLSTTGYVFYMQGCTGTVTNPGRQFSSRAFTITVE